MADSTARKSQIVNQKSKMNFAVLQFPASNCDQDAVHALRDVLDQTACYVWHKERSLGHADAVIVPGGFSYGDYLRCGAIARFSPVMSAVVPLANDGGLVLGICNGFQGLCEAGLLPGALVRKAGLPVVCDPVDVGVQSNDLPFLQRAEVGDVLTIPIKHGEGRYVADADVLKAMEDEGRVVLRYCEPDGSITPEANPNGSTDNIAGICNEQGNVFGMMPHPEHAID